MLGNDESRRGVISRITPSCLVALLWIICCSPVSASGLDWGGGGGGALDTVNCTPDDPLVIIPGPLGSPVRIAAFDAQTYLVADYSRKKISWFDSSGAFTPFFEALGKPLSVAINAKFKKNGKLKEAYYFIGNDDARTIDVYYEKNDQFDLVGQYPVADNGIQALDMVFDKDQNLLFVVDGLAREVKVIQPDGYLVRSFGIGNALIDPKGIAIDATAQEIYVSDYGDPFADGASIKIFNMQGGLQDTIYGSFARPQGLSLTDEKIFFVDNMLAKVLEFDRDSKLLVAYHGCKGSSDGHLLLPMDIVLDGAGQNLYVADNRNRRITVLPLVQP